jgi:hypothetical protein
MPRKEKPPRPAATHWTHEEAPTPGGKRRGLGGPPERRTAVGAFLRPHHFTLRFSDDNQTMTHYGPDYEHGKTYVGVDLEQV